METRIKYNYNHGKETIATANSLPFGNHRPVALLFEVIKKWVMFRKAFNCTSYNSQDQLSEDQLFQSFVCTPGVGILPQCYTVSVGEDEKVLLHPADSLGLLVFSIKLEISKVLRMAKASTLHA